jgi:hypothetical protein
MLTHKIQIGDVVYEAHTDFKTALKCNEIATDDTLRDDYRSLAIICVVFGEHGLDHQEHYQKLLQWIQKWLSCGKEIEKTDEEPDMDYQEDYDYIVASFQSDYGINLDEENMEWRRFINLMNGLSNSELGNCCVLNRIRNLRTYDTSKMEDQKEAEKIRKAQEKVALKKYRRENNLTAEQIKSMEEFNKLAGI